MLHNQAVRYDKSNSASFVDFLSFRSVACTSSRFIKRNTGQSLLAIMLTGQIAGKGPLLLCFQLVGLLEPCSVGQLDKISLAQNDRHQVITSQPQTNFFPSFALLLVEPKHGGDRKADRRHHSTSGIPGPPTILPLEAGMVSRACVLGAGMSDSPL
ncbi:hypothetical protein LX36DRAFT_227084 [Colletotrichum falcatum]|nr:hypothetical protein LX36DRAFT_227084 [Colletotrichum falcatum]